MPASHPVLSCSEARVWEARQLPDEAAEWTAMQAAGRKVALAVLDDYREIGGLPPQARILVLAGKGHNGGDALLAARTLLQECPAARVDVMLLFDESQLRPLARRSLDALRESAGTRFAAVTPEALHPGTAGNGSASADSPAPAGGTSPSWDLCLDGIFGFQFRPPLEPSLAAVITQANAHSGIRFRAAVDLPSGLGESAGSVVFRADFTYATGIVKGPVVDPIHAPAVGRLRYLDLGFFATDAKPETKTRVLVPGILDPIRSLRTPLSDKRTFGHLLMVGGSHSYPGAILMAVRAALRSGAGLVTVCVPERFAAEFALGLPEAMWVGCPVNASGGLATAGLSRIAEKLHRAGALLVGPGLGADPDTIALATRLTAEAKVPVVLDADALRPEVLAGLVGRPFVATPHAGEWQRIAPVLQSAGSSLPGPGILVLKGPLTRVTDGRVACLSPFGGPVLARGGSGDILAGLIGGLLAQHPEDPFLAACRGVVWHGRAADRLAQERGQVAVETSQLLDQLGPALAPSTW
ncbi:MAG: NAD(P)H-hydrate dehydratase [Opitutaceae bacterium]|nr:NAD(P)H-hydrate dehydratase [Opitutaceae bacterium]